MIETIFRYVEMLGVASLVIYAGDQADSLAVWAFGYLLAFLAGSHFSKKFGVWIGETALRATGGRQLRLVPGLVYLALVLMIAGGTVWFMIVLQAVIRATQHG